MIRRTTARRPRRASISMMALLGLPVLLLLVGLVVYIGISRGAKTEVQNVADVAALAGAWQLATDALLTDDREQEAVRVAAARDAAIELGRANVAFGGRVDLHRNEGNEPDGDVVLGVCDRRGTGVFEPARGTPDSQQWWDGSRVNAVRVTVWRGPVGGPLGGPTPEREVVGQATAMLDWGVVGFRPVTDAPVPLIPIGVATDHVGKAENTWSWDTHLLHAFKDEWRFDPARSEFVEVKSGEKGDGIAEVVVTLGREDGNQATVTGNFLRLGAASEDATHAQIVRGVTRTDLSGEFPGGFVLSVDNDVLVSGAVRSPSLKSPSSALEAVRVAGKPRIWPLVSRVTRPNVDGPNVYHVTGWMAARIVRFTVGGDGAVTLLLQPAVLSHPSAVTEGRDPQPVFWPNNRTVCRVRLAQ